jgi:hypothetical protein
MLVKLNLFDRSIDRIKMSFSKDTGEMKSNESILLKVALNTITLHPNPKIKSISNLSSKMEV